MRRLDCKRWCEFLPVQDSSKMMKFLAPRAILTSKSDWKFPVGAGLLGFLEALRFFRGSFSDPIPVSLLSDYGGI